MGLSRRYVATLAPRELHKFDTLPTPYGTVIEQSELVGKEGTMQFQNLNVFAFIYYVCSISVYFATVYNSCIHKNLMAT